MMPEQSGSASIPPGFKGINYVAPDGENLPEPEGGFPPAQAPVCGSARPDSAQERARLRDRIARIRLVREDELEAEEMEQYRREFEEEEAATQP